MYSLPSLSPHDSYSLWYTASHDNPLHHTEPLNTSTDHATVQGQGHDAGHSHRRQQGLHRTPLARLRLDEEYMERRKQNVQNYGNSWIKPPGIPKSLYQLREEKREMEEHQEALRREALAQELADAEVDGAADLLQGEGMDGEMEEVPDLDDEVPDADDTGIDAEETDNDELENEEVEEVPRGVLASRLPEDVYREALIRGEEGRGNRFGDEAGSAGDEEDSAQMLQEEDLVAEAGLHLLAMDMDMDGDLDADVPDAEEEYEHTDTEEELSSSEAESDDARFPQRNPAASSMVRSDGTQNSMDVGNMISSGSSRIGSSPQPRSGFRDHGSSH